VDRFTSSQDQNDYQSTTHIVEYISPSEILHFVIFACNFTKGQHIAAATWLCTYGICYKQMLLSRPASLLHSAKCIHLTLTGGATLSDTDINLTRCTYTNLPLYTLPLVLSLSRIRMAALGYSSTRFCFVVRQYLGFFPCQVHILEVSFDDVYPCSSSLVVLVFSCNLSVPTVLPDELFWCCPFSRRV